MFNSLFKRRQEAMGGDWPHRVVYLRGNMCSGDMQSVMEVEIQALKTAFEENMQSVLEILAITVQRSHQTRFFPKSGDPKANMPAGTVLLDHLSAPLPYPNFFLLSHAGIKGTSHPARYVVLYDTVGSNDPSLRGMDTSHILQEYAKLMFFLCFLYGRCQRSVSMPAPLYYATLFQERIRLLCDGITRTHLGLGCASNDDVVAHEENTVPDKKVDTMISQINQLLGAVSTEAVPMFYS
eukprot:Protomagalhaensia_sp_Gyna_25__3235@NODE_2944_length_807_cov_11_690104_g2459_i0_p1_GENE_NODE_2944_length_807_cov_11_690104_g2459_i0NODE_2944_length_807_cov_11_690104_g2459_i0_p1_ORF_typecomplete_len245_score26_41Piwi/PF02171_17/2e39_NODE_2944_length_807_cov_11_690104_g2459_i071784